MSEKVLAWKCISSFLTSEANTPPGKQPNYIRDQERFLFFKYKDRKIIVTKNGVVRNGQNYNPDSNISDTVIPMEMAEAALNMLQVKEKFLKDFYYMLY